MNTQRLTNKAWEEFVDWCQSRGLNPVPANPWTLAAFIRWCEPRHRPAAIQTLVNGISKIHAEKTRKRLDRDPLVVNTLKMIEQRAKTKDSSADLFDDAEILNTDGPAKKTTKRSTAKKTNSAKKKKSPAAAKRALSVKPRLVSRRKLSR